MDMTVLMNSSGYSAVAAAENYFSAVDSSKTFVPGQRLEQVCGWTKKLLEGALNVEEVANRMGRARVRQDLVDPLKYEIDAKNPSTNTDFITCCVEWQAQQPLDNRQTHKLSRDPSVETNRHLTEWVKRVA